MHACGKFYVVDRIFWVKIVLFEEKEYITLIVISVIILCKY